MKHAVVANSTNTTDDIFQVERVIFICFGDISNDKTNSNEFNLCRHIK